MTEEAASIVNEHERGFLEFLAEPHRRRVARLLELGASRRGTLLSMLHSKLRLAPGCATHLSGGDSFPGPLEAILRRHGAPPLCHVIAPGDLDGREVPLNEALDALVGWGDGAFVSCVPGRLGYYQYTWRKSQYVLRRPG